jgi:hypothetical protein
LKFYRQLGYQSTKETISLGAKWKAPFIYLEKKGVFHLIVQTIKLIE